MRLHGLLLMPVVMSACVAAEITPADAARDREGARVWFMEEFAHVQNPALASAIADCVMDDLTPTQIRQIAAAKSEDAYVAVVEGAGLPLPRTYIPCGEARLA